MGDKRQKKKLGFINDLGKLLVDNSKLIFGGLVIGTAIRWDVSHKTLFIIGVISSAITGIVDIFMARLYEEK